MIHHPIAIIASLIVIEAVVLYFSSQGRFKKYFQFLPFIFWIYFLPILASTFGLIDSKAEILPKISTYLLPPSLFLLLMVVDLKSIMRLGKTALIMFLSGALGIMIGVPISFFIFKRWVGEEMWSTFGALSASWIGGSANLIAVKEALGAPDDIFMPIVIVDTTIPYFWMGILVALAGLQSKYDKWNKSDERILSVISQRMILVQEQKASSLRADKMILVLLLAVVVGFLSQGIAQTLPVIKGMITTYTWVILIVSLLGMLCSLTPLRRLENFGASRVGYFMLFFVLTSLGARANLSNIGTSAVLLLAGILILLIHAGTLLLASKIFKAPLFLVATASQAGIGGVASAPIVAEVYQKGFAPVGLLMAILGNILGTYLGIFVGQICRMISGL